MKGKKLLGDLAILLDISKERHMAEARRVSSNDLLATIAYRLTGRDWCEDWDKEGRSAVGPIYRFPPLTVTIPLADKVAHLAMTTTSQEELNNELEKVLKGRCSHKDQGNKMKVVKEEVIEPLKGYNRKKKTNESVQVFEELSKIATGMEIEVDSRKGNTEDESDGNKSQREERNEVVGEGDVIKEERDTVKVEEKGDKGDQDQEFERVRVIMDEGNVHEREDEVSEEGEEEEEELEVEEEMENEEEVGETETEGDEVKEEGAEEVELEVGAEESVFVEEVVTQEDSSGTLLELSPGIYSLADSSMDIPEVNIERRKAARSTNVRQLRQANSCISLGNPSRRPNSSIVMTEPLLNHFFSSTEDRNGVDLTPDEQLVCSIGANQSEDNEGPIIVYNNVVSGEEVSAQGSSSIDQTSPRICSPINCFSPAEFCNGLSREETVEEQDNSTEPFQDEVSIPESKASSVGSKRPKSPSTNSNKSSSSKKQKLEGGQLVKLRVKGVKNLLELTKNANVEPLKLEDLLGRLVSNRSNQLSLSHKIQEDIPQPETSMAVGDEHGFELNGNASTEDSSGRGEPYMSSKSLPSPLQLHRKAIFSSDQSSARNLTK